MNLKKITAFFLMIFMMSTSYSTFALTPSEINSGVFHFDLNNLDGDNNSATQPANNSNIQNLIDEANSYTGSQNNVSKQAIFDANAFDNRGGLYFDGIDDLYTIEDNIDIGSNDNYDEKSFAVVIQTSGDISSLQTIYEQGGKEKGYAIQIENSRLYVGVWNTIDWNAGEEFKIADLGVIQQNSLYNIIMYQDSSTNNNLAVYIDGALVKNILNVSSQKAHGTCVISGSFDCYMFANGGSIGIGATKNDTLRLSDSTGQTADESHHFEGHIGELASWNHALTTTEVQGLFEYFDTKWGIKKPEINIQSPAIIGSVNVGDSQAYITYNDFQNGNAIDVNSDDIKLYQWNGTSWSADVASSYVNFFTKDISEFEARFEFNNLVKGKYRLEFSIAKTNGESSTQSRDFYVGSLNPDEISNPVFHYDAQDINADNNYGNNPVSGSQVQTLVDKFNGYNAIQNTVNRRPILENNIINTFPAVKFNGTSQYFDIANQDPINNRANPSYTQKSFAAVFKTGNDVNTFQTIYEQGGNARGYSFVIDNGHVYAGVWNTSEWDTGHEYKSVDLGLAQPNTTYFAMIVQDSQSSDDSLNTLKIYLNGNLASIQDHVDPQERNPGGISIGRVNGNSVSASTNTVVGSSGFFFNGYIGELISWNFSLDQADVNGVQEYFSNKWGIVLFSEKFAIPSPTSDATPAYTFTTNKAGSLTFNGGCNSTTNAAVLGENIINLGADTSGTALANGVYDNCSISLLDENGFSHVLNITPFEVIATSYTLTEVNPIATPSSNHFPTYTFSSPIEGALEYFGSCNSNSSFAVIGNNTIQFNYLPDGVYDNCYVRVNNGGVEQSEYLLLSTFSIVSSAPVFGNISIGDSQLLAQGNNILSINYSDSSDINTSSANITLEKYNSTTSNWGSNIASGNINLLGANQDQAIYQTSINDFGKYRWTFSIENIHGTSESISQIFYIDQPNFSIDSSNVNIGNLNSNSLSLSTPVEINVETLGAGFSMLIKKSGDFSSHNNTLNEYDSTTGYGYDSTPLNGTIQSISSVETFASQSENININGDKNIYTYYVRLGAIIDELQSAGDYSGNIQFGIQLQYD